MAAEPEAPAIAARSGRVVTLTQALASAKAHQPQLAAARASRLAAEAQADQARAGFLPQVNGTASFQLREGSALSRTVTGAGSAGPATTPGGTSTGGTGTSGTTTVGTTGVFSSSPTLWNFGLSASQLIYDFGQTPGRWRAARANASALEATERSTAEDVALQVRNAFFTARAARAMVQVADETLANQERHLEQIQGFVELGSRPAIDLSQARADRGNARVQLITAQNDYDVARATLLQAMGSESDTDFELGDETLPPLPEEDAPLAQLLDEALRARPELANLQSLITGQQETLRGSKGGYAPVLSASSTVGENGPALDQLNWIWTGSLNLSWSLFQGGATRAIVQQNAAQLVRAEAQLTTQRQQIRLEVQQAQLGLRAAKATLEAAAETAESAADRLKLAEGRYATGIGSIIELGDAQVAHTSAEAQKIRAEFQLFSARAQLLHALGRP